VPERLAATVARLKSRAASGSVPSDLALLLRELAKAGTPADTAPPLTWITASHGRETRLIMVDDVAYFRADNKYTVAMTADGEALLRKPIRELLAVLDPASFKQIHRSTIVNLKAIAAIVRDDTGKGTVRLKARPETLTVSLPFMTLFRHM
jgi:DNA-binding LytR/AlgR family response regulator